MDINEAGFSLSPIGRFCGSVVLGKLFPMDTAEPVPATDNPPLPSAAEAIPGPRDELDCEARCNERSLLSISYSVDGKNNMFMLPINFSPD